MHKNVSPIDNIIQIYTSEWALEIKTQPALDESAIIVNENGAEKSVLISDTDEGIAKGNL